MREGKKMIIIIRSFLCVVIGMLTKYFMNRSGIEVLSPKGILVLIVLFFALEAVLYLTLDN